VIGEHDGRHGLEEAEAPLDAIAATMPTGARMRRMRNDSSRTGSATRAPRIGGRELVM
jgi:hypothetical protein